MSHRSINHRTRAFRGVVAAGAVLLVGGTLAACGDDSDSASDTTADESAQQSSAEVRISDVWARTGTAGGNTAVYMEITGGTEPSDLVAASVSTDVAVEAQIHETTSSGGMTEDEGTGAGDDMGTDDMGDMSGEPGEGEVGTDDTATDTTSGDDMGDMSDGDMGDMGGSGEGEDGDGHSGMMSMQEVSAIAIPAGETVALEPGGFHVMLLDLASDLAVGDTVEVTLSFEGGYTETVTAEVRES